MPNASGGASVVVSAMADGIGDLTFASPEWVEAARESMAAEAAKYAAELADLGPFTLCEVAHNPPAYLHCGPTLAWHVKFARGTVEAQPGELPDEECDFKPDEWIQRSQLYLGYRDWCSINGLKSITRQGFNERLRRGPPQLMERRRNGIDGWLGIQRRGKAAA